LNSHSQLSYQFIGPDPGLLVVDGAGDHPFIYLGSFDKLFHLDFDPDWTGERSVTEIFQTADQTLCSNQSLKMSVEKKIRSQLK